MAHLIDVLQTNVIYNETIYKCNTMVVSINSFVKVSIKYILTFFGLLILNILSIIGLARNAKSSIAINMKKNTLFRKRLYVRFSVATAISNLFYCLIHIVNIGFIISGFFPDNKSGFIVHYIIFVNTFSTVICPIVYMILFKNVRIFFCFLLNKS